MVHAKLIVVVLRIRILDENIICFKKWFTAYVYGLGSRGNRREYKKRQIDQEAENMHIHTQCFLERFFFSISVLVAGS